MPALGIAAATLAFALPGPAFSARGEQALDPAGVWSCVVFAGEGPPDERVVLHLVADGGTRFARQGERTTSQWAPLSDWTIERDELRFVDYRNSRRFVADLQRARLGGQWESPRGRGGWWCMRRSEAGSGQGSAASRPPAEFFVPPLVPDVIAAPVYPRQAIREATEGRAVVCFVVDSNGVVVEPEIVELSDEIFRDSTMIAINRTRYRPWSESSLGRAGCRSYTYELDAVF